MANYFIVKDDNDNLGLTQVCSCGCENVHIRSIEAFCRHEDSEITLYAIDMKHGLEDTIGYYPAKDCPSSRRNALIIYFYCEEGCEFSLIISQHKGTNMINGNSTHIPWPNDEFEVIE